MAASYRPRVWLALATIYIVWGSTFMAVTIAVRDVPPLLAMGIRHVTAGTLLLAWALPRGDRKGDPIGRTQIRAGFIFGGALFLLGHGGLAWAQQTVPSGVAALLIGSIPLWMALLDRIFFGKRLHPSATLGLVVGFAGLAFLFDPFGEGSFDRLGAVVCVLAALAWAAGSLYSRGAPLPKRPLVSAGLAALCGGVLLLVAGAARGELGDLHPTADALGAIAYLVVVGTLVGFVAVRLAPPQRAHVARRHLRVREPRDRGRARLAFPRRGDHGADARRRRGHPCLGCAHRPQRAARCWSPGAACDAVQRRF